MSQNAFVSYIPICVIQIVLRICTKCAKYACFENIFVFHTESRGMLDNNAEICYNYFAALKLYSLKVVKRKSATAAGRITRQRILFI